MSYIIIEIVVIILLTIINGIFAMSEIAVVSARKARLQQWAESGNRRARLALNMANSPDNFLSTVQVGITLIGVLAGAFGGATIAQHLTVRISDIPSIAAYAETIAVGIIVLAITYFSLILGELVPKRIALNNPERIAAFIAGPMRLLSRIAVPAVWFLGISTNALLRLLRIRKTTEPPVTEDEIRILIRQGTEAGVIQRNERDIVDRVFRLDERRSSKIMTPRNDLVIIFTSDSPEQIYSKVKGTEQSVFPLCEGALDNILGIVRAQDILSQILGGNKIDLKALVRRSLFLPSSLSSLKLLEEFKKTGDTVAILLDEYGGLEGLVTASHILTALVGEILYTDIPHAVQYPDGSFLIDGMLLIDELKATLQIDNIPEEYNSIETTGGLMMALFGRIPSEGDKIIWNKYQFIIVDMDGKRIDKIMANKVLSSE